MGTWASANLALPESTALPCARCGYDLRAQPREGICPECAAPVQKAIELAAIPVRPAWRDSDPRWRRRMVAGAWVMVMVPLLEVLRWAGILEGVRLPVSSYQGDFLLRDSFVTWIYVYLVFCIGVVLFFSRERGRKRHALDWTRRWGVIMSYLVLLLGVVMHGLLVALVLVGIGALFISLPIENQPAVTDLAITIGSGYLRFGPNDDSWVAIALVMGCSAVAVLLACVPLYHAMRSSGPRVLAMVLLVMLALICAWQIWRSGIWYLNPASKEPPFFFFSPSTLVAGGARLGSGQKLWPGSTASFVVEAAKWLIFLMIAIWLSIAQVRACRKAPASKAAAT